MGLKLQRKVLASALPKDLRFLTTVLALYAEEDGREVRPSIDRLARELRVDRSTIIRKLNALKALGVLVVRRQGGGGAHQPTDYQLMADALPVASHGRALPIVVIEPPIERTNQAHVPWVRRDQKLLTESNSGRTGATANESDSSRVDAGRNARHGCASEKYQHTDDGGNADAPFQLSRKGSGRPGRASTATTECVAARQPGVQKPD